MEFDPGLMQGVGPVHYKHIENYYNEDNHQRFWIREETPIHIHADDYEWYGFQARLVGQEISWRTLGNTISSIVKSILRTC